MKILFWRRLAATWVDLFLVYSAASLGVGIGAICGMRLAVEPVFVAMAATYGTVLLWLRGQTFGKAVMGLGVQRLSGGRLGWGRAIAREVAGKWLISVGIPLAVGRGLLKHAWVPTVFDSLTLGLTLVILVVYTLVAKRPWYDWLAETVVRRVPAPSGLRRIAVAVLLVSVLAGWGSKAVEYAAQGHLRCRLLLHQSMRSIGPYTRFLAQGQATPVDYVFSLFERYDVVVLCERPHSEASQWDFIFSVVSDPRFAQVGQVFTEYGNSSQQAYLDEFMSTDGLTPAEVHDRVVHLMRNWSVWPTWPNLNFYTYLTRLYALNQSRPPASRIRHHFTDVPEDWTQLTPESMPQHWRSMGTRDRSMADRVIDEMRLLTPSSARPAKCLVVMNFRHAFDLTGRAAGAARENTFEFLKDAFGDRAANVLLNTSVVFVAPIAGGLWDQASQATGNVPVGFDFAGSPFGEDRFDLFFFAPPVQARFRYRDVFTGFVFTHPLTDQYTEVGIPGYFAGVEPEMRRRAALVGADYARTVELMIREEQRGRVRVRQPLFQFRAETWIELGLSALASVGLLIGLVHLRSLH